MWQALHDAWWRLATLSQPQSFSDALVCHALSAGSLAYRAAVGSRNAAFDLGWMRQERLPCRVVSVGNLTVGGTGKTACVELIARHLTELNRRVAILSRGYGGARREYWLRCDGGVMLVNGQPAPQHNDLADEPQLLAKHLAGVAIVVGPKRSRSGRLACHTLGADTVILDDGFQHRQLCRDCEIVLVHVRTPLGGWALLPRGPMREPFTALRRADVVIITKADEGLERVGALTERVRAINPNAVIATAVHEPATVMDAMTGAPYEPARLNGLRVGLVSSIGDPEGFESTVKRLHATVLWHWALPDHYAYQGHDWHSMTARGQGMSPDAVITTEKDWVRLRPLAHARPPNAVPLWVLGVRMKLLHGEAQLHDRLARVYAR